MKRIVLFLSLMCATYLSSAQSIVPRLGFVYVAEVQGNGLPAFLMGLEVGSSKHWTINGDFHSGAIANDREGAVLVNRRQFGLDADVNFYTRTALQGFYLSGGAFYNRQTTDPVDPNEHINASARANVQGGLNFGLGVSQNVKRLNFRVFAKMGYDFYGVEDARLLFGVAAGYRF